MKSDRLSKPFAGAAPPKLVVYGRRNCHLCDVAKEVIEAVASRIRFEVEERDVDDDPCWAEAYGEQVPVGFIGGRKVFKYRVRPDDLERALRGRDYWPDGR